MSTSVLIEFNIYIMKDTIYKSKIPELKLKRIKTDFPKIKVNSSRSASDFIRNFYFDDITIYESFFILLLNRNNNTIGYAKISQGGISGTTVDIKLMAKYAVESLASGIILAHNHPSGNLKPSNSDIRLTERIAKALSIFDCAVMDHIILTEESFYSFADEGLI